MMFEEKFFVNKRMNEVKLLNYGFTKQENGYQYTTSVMDGQLILLILISYDGSMFTQMLDPSTNEEYLLYKIPSSVGAYVGEVRAALENILSDISLNCYDPEVFHHQQAVALIFDIINTRKVVFRCLYMI